MSDEDIRPVKLTIDGKERVFDIDEPDLPEWIDKKALQSGGYPYDRKMDWDEYEKTIEALQVEMVKLQVWMQQTGHRIIAVFEGRDAAGKGGSISALHEFLNPRTARNVALSKPTETERGQWYFQRYVAHFPTAGELVSYDRSWYNRAGVEPVMGFCTPQQAENFLAETPRFEKTVVDEGILLFKFWLGIGQEMQLKRFHDRRHSPLKHWKLSGIDIAGMEKWDDYTKARNRMLAATNSKHAPWTVIRSNDKRRARLEVLRTILRSIEFPGRNAGAFLEANPKIVGVGPKAFDQD
ncbi:MAG TPA: polyphosphate kinase 2 [Rhizobiaceae bacterium]|nr:polyphosphate kinase 2 [Rhizobiaceae bacterium]